MTSLMRHEDIVLAALIYRRNVGADLDAIRAFAFIREAKKHTSKEDKVALANLATRGLAVQIGNSWSLTNEAYRTAKGAALAPRLKDEDAWILLSLFYSQTKEPTTLHEIIATADSINRAIPSLEEIHGALNRLDAAALIKRRGDGFIVTQRGFDLFSKVKACCKKSVNTQLEGLRQMMTCPCCGPDLKAVRWRIIIKESEYETAVKSYSSRI